MENARNYECLFCIEENYIIMKEKHQYLFTTSSVVTV